jgi:hypothetical protein
MSATPEQIDHHEATAPSWDVAIPASDGLAASSWVAIAAGAPWGPVTDDAAVESGRPDEKALTAERRALRSAVWLEEEGNPWGTPFLTERLDVL